MTDLPKLKIGCGIPLGKVGDAPPLFLCVGSRLCPTCQHNLDAVKAHAASHQKKAEELREFMRRKPKSDSWINEHVIARDAVLALAGLTPKDLEQM